jgi:hypothetical protein
MICRESATIVHDINTTVWYRACYEFIDEGLEDNETDYCERLRHALTDFRDGCGIKTLVGDGTFM